MIERPIATILRPRLVSSSQTILASFPENDFDDIDDEAEKTNQRPNDDYQDEDRYNNLVHFSPKPFQLPFQAGTVINFQQFAYQVKSLN